MQEQEREMIFRQEQAKQVTYFKIFLYGMFDDYVVRRTMSVMLMSFDDTLFLDARSSGGNHRRSGNS